MQKKINRNYIVLFLKGMAMGAADVVPGVSGFLEFQVEPLLLYLVFMRSS